MQIPDIRAHTARVVSAVGRTMFGLDDEIRMCLAALYTGGHVLLEGNPGIGKTELVKSLGQVLRLDTGRIQFTPDLMPADITGTLMPSPERELTFQKGPIFTSLLLADEINRATPKTQSAMLEAMAEKRVTVLGVGRALPEPFVVLATQNPIDHEGTYNLPAAQSDRFMFKVRMPLPTAETLERIVIKRAGAGAPNAQATRQSPGDIDVAADGAAPDGDAVAIVRQVRDTILNVEPTRVVQQHITNLYLALNGDVSSIHGAAGTASDIRTAAGRFQYGISPRAAGDVMLASKAWLCLTDGDLENVGVSHLRAVVVPALRHRLKPSLDHDLELDASSNGADRDTLHDRAIQRLVALTAPKDSGSDRLWPGW
jgi:MoxR-like ATPase